MIRIAVERILIIAEFWDWLGYTEEIEQHKTGKN